MRIGLIGVAAAGLLQGCAPQVPASQTAALALGEQVRCVPVQQIIARRATGPRTLEFEVAGGITYRNDLPEMCPGLENRTNFDVVLLEVDGAQVCAGDSFRAIEPLEAQAVGARAFPRCRLGAFTRIPNATR